MRRSGIIVSSAIILAALAARPGQAADMQKVDVMKELESHNQTTIACLMMWSNRTRFDTISGLTTIYMNDASTHEMGLQYLRNAHHDFTTFRAITNNYDDYLNHLALTGNTDVNPSIIMAQIIEEFKSADKRFTINVLSGMGAALHQNADDLKQTMIASDDCLKKQGDMTGDPIAVSRDDLTDEDTADLYERLFVIPPGGGQKVGG